MSLSWNSIITLVTYPILSPFYIIAFKKWYALRNDWIFSLRYSLELLILVITSIFITHICVIRSLLYDLGYLNDKKLADMTAIVYTLHWIIFCTVYYRTNLIILSFRQSQARLNQMRSLAISLIPRKHCSSYILLSIVICGAFFNLIFMLIRSRLAYLIWAFQWFFMYLVGIILFIVVKCKRVKELFGCLYECYILFFIIVSHWLVRIFTPKSDTNIRLFEGYVYSHIISLFILYYTLYFLHKHKYKYECQLERRASFASLGSTSRTPSDEQHEQHEHAVHVNIEAHETLSVYLNNKNNYEIFRKYLAYCWCLENLLFVEKVCVFYWLVMKMNVSSENKQLQVGKHVYSIKFEFLTDIYNEYEEIINKCDDCFENQRDVLWSVCHNVYNQYINDNSMDQVNISYEVRCQLDYLLKTNDNISTFRSLNDFLNLFDGAMGNTIRLLTSVYGFQFTSYLQHHQ